MLQGQDISADIQLKYIDPRVYTSTHVQGQEISDIQLKYIDPRIYPSTQLQGQDKGRIFQEI